MLLVLPLCGASTSSLFFLGLISLFLSFFRSLHLAILSFLLSVDSDAPQSSNVNAAHDIMREGLHERERSFVSSCLNASFCIFLSV